MFNYSHVFLPCRLKTILQRMNKQAVYAVIMWDYVYYLFIVYPLFIMPRVGKADSDLSSSDGHKVVPGNKKEAFFPIKSISHKPRMPHHLGTARYSP